MNGIIFFKKLKIIRIILDVQKASDIEESLSLYYSSVLARLVWYLSALRNTY